MSRSLKSDNLKLHQTTTLKNLANPPLNLGPLDQPTETMDPMWKKDQLELNMSLLAVDYSSRETLPKTQYHKNK